VFARLLRREILELAFNDAGGHAHRDRQGRELARRRLEIAQRHLALRDRHVIRTHARVDDPHRVDRVECSTELQRDRDRDRLAGCAPGPARGLEELGETRPAPRERECSALPRRRDVTESR